MNESLLAQIEFEVREEFHIPPYFENLENLIKESDAFMQTQLEDIDYDNDLLARSLLKDNVFYAYNNRSNDFELDYQAKLNTWKFSKIGSGE